MSSTPPCSFTVEEGQYLLLESKSLGLPEKLGETKFQETERIEASLQVLELWKALKLVSPGLSGPGRKLLFGPSENWVPFQTSGDSFVATNLALSVNVGLSEDAQAGALWCCLVSSHPLSAKVKPNDIIDAVFLPIAIKLGQGAELLAMIRPPKKEQKSRWAAKS